MELTMSGVGIVFTRPGGTGPVIDPWTVYASDDFNAADGTILNTRTLPNALGGTATAAWATSVSSPFTIAANRLHRGSSTVAAVGGVPMPTPNHGIAVRLVTLPTGASIGLVVRRTALSGGTDHRLSINGSTASLLVSGATPANFTVAAGDVVGIRAKGAVLEALRNDVVVSTAPATLPDPGYAGISLSANAVYDIEDAVFRVPAP